VRVSWLPPARSPNTIKPNRSSREQPQRPPGVRWLSRRRFHGQARRGAASSTKAHERCLLNGVTRVLGAIAYPRSGASERPAARARWALLSASVLPVATYPSAASMRLPGVTGVHPWPHAGHARPLASGDFAPPVNAPLGPWSLAPVQATLWQMRLRRTLRRSRADHPVFAWAFGYALAAVVVGAGMLLIGPSPGVGWALVVFGGWLATLTSGPATRPQGEADAQHRRVGLSSVASTRARPPNPTRPRSTARGRSQPAFARSAPDCASGSRGASACLGVVALPGQAAISARRRRPHRRPPAALYRRQPEAPQRFLVADTDTANHPARCPLRRGSALMAGPTRLLDGTRARADGGGRPVRPRAWRAVR
jgi:hypothetical protein